MDHLVTSDRRRRTRDTAGCAVTPPISKSRFIVLALVIMGKLTLNLEQSITRSPGAGRRLAAVHPFLIDYGWIPQAPAAYRTFVHRIHGYPLIVLGSGDKWPASGDETPTQKLIQQQRQIQFYGYVNLGVTDGQPHSLTTIQFFE
ncbi:MAG: hypothetical protein C7B44_14930 [Sulfobacillus thermosulfidooxidans]|nr:MAG: hypothetical protein C7B44_14930 [Sulfobacillus thermosulfidooxidans]